MGRHGWVATLVGGLTFLGTDDVRAAPTSKLTYVRGPGAEQCPAEPELRAAVAKRVGYDPFFPHADRTVVATIESAPKSRFSAKARVLDVEGRLIGERSLDPMTDCGEVVQSLALAISVALDDLDAARIEKTPEETPPPPPPPPPSPTELAPKEHPPVPPPPPEGDAPPIRVRLSAGTAGVLGVGPAPAFAFVAGVGVKRAAWSAALEGRGHLTATEALAGGGSLATSSPRSSGTAE